MSPLVSVIVPNYNHGQFLKRRLDSILSQTLKEFEVILLDDASTDNSLHILQVYAKHPLVSRLVQSTKNSGSPFGQWEKGLLLSAGKYVWIAESDDFADERFLEVLVDVLERDSAIGMVYCDSEVVDEYDTIKKQELISRESFTMEGHDFLRMHLYHKCAIPNVSSALIRKEIMKSVGFIPSNFRYVGDWMFWIRFFESGTKVCFVNEKLNYFRTHSGTTRSLGARQKFVEYMIESFSILNYSKRTGNADLSRIEARMDFLANKISKQFPRASIFGQAGRSLLWRTMPYDPKLLLRIVRRKLRMS